MPKSMDEVKAYLAEIGRKGGKKPSPLKKYNSDAERQRAYRERQKAKSRDANAKPESGEPST